MAKEWSHKLERIGELVPDDFGDAPARFARPTDEYLHRRPAPVGNSQDILLLRELRIRSWGRLGRAGAWSSDPVPVQ